MKKILVAAAVIISSLAQAQTDSSRNLETVVVTANKIEQKQNETGKVLTVISREQLERATGRSLGELLNEQVGMVIGGANDNAGTNLTMYVRGASSANTLILLDGVPLNDPSGVTSEFDLNTFSTTLIERIEILKGAQSTLYGSDAVAGVVNIITRKSEKGFRVQANAGYGSFGTLRSGMNITGAAKSFSYQAGYSVLSSAGFSSAHDSTGNSNYEKDKFRQHVAQLGIGYSGVKHLHIHLYGKFNVNRGDIDGGAYQDDRDFNFETKNSLAGLNVKYNIGRSFIALLYNYNNYTRNYRDDSSDVAGIPYASSAPYSFIFQEGNYKGRSHFSELYGNVFINRKLNIVAGTDMRQNSTGQSFQYAVKDLGVFNSLELNDDTASVKQFSGYASAIYNDQKHFSVSIGGRYNDHSVYGDVFTYSFNPAFTFNKVKVFGNAASAFRVPTLYQLFSEYGNRELKPERSVNYEAGVEFSSRKISARLVGFKRDIKDVFAFYTDYTTYISRYINYDKQKDKGIEAELAYTPDKKLQVTANYTYTEGRLHTTSNSGKDTTYSNLYRRPKNILNARLTYFIIPGLNISLQARNVSSFFEPRFGIEPLKIDGYTVLNFHTSWQVKRNVRLFADVINLGNKEYFDQPGFNTRPLSVNGGIMLSFEKQ